MTDAILIESTLLRYPGVALARVIRTADGEVIAKILPWGCRPGEPDTGTLAEVAAINPSETRFLHDEIFVAESYLRGGIVLRQDAVVFDVGANIGLFSIFVAARCPSARIFAFEPVPDVCAVLRNNIARRGIRALCYELGLSDRDQEIRFNFYPDISIMSCRSDYANLDNERDLLTLYVQHERKSGPPGRERHLAEVEALLARDFEFIERCVQLRRTSTMIDETGVPVIDLLKIDVQRSELDVLLGVDSRHWPRIQQISMEVHEAGHPTEGRLPAVLALLRDKGFQVRFAEPEMLAGTGRFAVQAVRPAYADDPRPIVAASGTDRPPEVHLLWAWLAKQLPSGLLPDRVVIVSTLG